MVVALQWVSTITSVSIAMVGPGLLGLWLDWLLGTRVVFGLLGFGIGLPYGIWALVRLANKKKNPDGSTDPEPPPTTRRP